MENWTNLKVKLLDLYAGFQCSDRHDDTVRKDMCSRVIGMMDEIERIKGSEDRPL